MQRERWNTAAAPRDRPVGVAVGMTVGRAVASEENCARFNESQGVDKEPVPLTTGMTHEYNSSVQLPSYSTAVAETDGLRARWCWLLSYKFFSLGRASPGGGRETWQAQF